MHKIAHTLAMTVVLYHLLVGCCWHLAHFDALTWMDANSFAVVDGDHAHQHDHHRESPCNPQQRQHGDCDGAKCVFVVPQIEGRVPLTDKTLVADVACSDIGLQSLYSAKHSAHEIPAPGELPPLRPHLVIQVLLI